MRIGLVACVKSKRATPTRAADLYTSPLFRGGRRAVEQSCDRWFILSAKHGLLDPDEVVEPYEETLSGAPRQDKRRWSRRVLGQIFALVEPEGVVFEIHAGEDYHAWGLSRGLRDAGAQVELPTAGLPLGRKLAYYSAGTDRTDLAVDVAASVAARSKTTPGPSVTPPRASGVYQPLHDHLDQLDQPRWTADFAEVEEVLGRPLPASARTYAAWWSNTTSHTQARAWLAVGWRTTELELEAEQVTFVKEQT